MIGTVPENSSRKRSARNAKAPQARRAAGKKAAGILLESPDYVYHKAFAGSDAEQALWGKDSPEIPVAHYALRPAIDGDKPPAVGKLPRLSADQEKTLFLRYNYAKYRLANLLQARGKGRPTKFRREVDQWRLRAQQTREKLVHANLALVPSMAKRMRGSDLEFGELVSEGHLAILRSVEKFDVSRGFKFSTYACRAILACFRRMAGKARRNSARFPVAFVPEIERSDFEERCHEQQHQDTVDMVREVLHRNLADLSEMEFRVIQERFTMTQDGKRPTLGLISQGVGLSVEGVRQIIKKALSKIRISVEARLTA